MADEATATAPAPQGSAFADAPPAEPPAPAPASAASEPAPPEAPAPDLSEQEQALIAKLAGPLGDAVVERVQGKPGEEPAPLSAGDTASRLLGGEPDPSQPQPPDDGGYYQDTYGYEDPYQQQQQGQQQGLQPDDPILQSPVVQALIQQSDATQQYLEGLVAEQQEAAILKLAEENPDLRQEEVLTEVEAVAQRLAERAGRPELATDPTYVETALRAVRSARATSAEVPAQEARNQGASLPTDAGAAVDGTPSPEDQWWSGIAGAGGDAFPS